MDLTSPLFSPQMQDDNPVQIVANTDAGNADPSVFSMTEGGIAQYKKYNEFLISWTAISNAAFYRLYASVSPIGQSSLYQDNILTNSTSFVPPLFVQNLEYYFWVSAVDAQGNEAYLSDIPSTLETTREKMTKTDNPVSDSDVVPDSAGWNEEFIQDIETIRAGNRFELENGGEDAILYLKRYGEDRPYGKPCACTGDDGDPDNQGRGRCTQCFGVGTTGGYHFGVGVKLRYNSTPSKKFVHGKFGYEELHAWNSACLWSPVVRTGDLIVRLMDGSRYEITDRQESSVRGVRLHQNFDISNIGVKDIRWLVTDNNIAKALAQANVAGFITDGFRNFG